MQSQYKTVFVCEDSLEGILSGIYKAYESRLPLEQVELQVEKEVVPTLFTEFTSVPNSPENALKVARTLKEKMGEKHYYDFCMLLTSYQEGKANAALAVVKWALKNKIHRFLFENMADREIGHAFVCYRNANYEMEHLRGFLRFSELEEGLLYAEMEPKNDVIVYLAEHFADRLPKENFIICDRGRELYAIHPAGKEWFLMREENAVPSMENVRFSEAEEYYRELFCHFCDSLCIKERTNLNLQRNMLPLRFRPYMTEFRRHR